MARVPEQYGGRLDKIATRCYEKLSIYGGFA